MNRDHECEELIELGVASVETKGATFGKDDHQVGLIPFAGLSDE